VSIHPSLLYVRHLSETFLEDHPFARLVVCRTSHFAEERVPYRQELLAATENSLEEVRAATLRTRRPLRGKDNIGVRVGKVINRYKVGKHFEIEIAEKSFSYRRNEEKINQEAALDGLYAVRTSVGADTLDDASVVRAYKDLSQVEQAFRSLKTVDLKVRPIHHWLEHRVRAHVFLCMLAYYVEWHMRQAWRRSSSRKTTRKEPKPIASRLLLRLSAPIAPVKKNNRNRLKRACRFIALAHSWRTSPPWCATVFVLR
jgi:hypothetical protein